jgi:SAM-dependent methyltransferase
MERVVLEAVCCPLCASQHSRTVLVGADQVHQVPGSFRVCQCLECGLLYQNPRPAAESFQAIYPPAYVPYQLPACLPPLQVRELTDTCDLIGRLQPAGGRLLDIGCGPGVFLRMLRAQQPAWEVAGIEPDAQAAALARAQSLAVQQCRLEEVDLQPSSWDAVTMWNVLEHLPDPRRTLHTVRQLLRADGLLYLAVPLCDSWDARLFGRYWLGWELPRHFVLFSRATLGELLARTGYELVATACINGVEYGFTESMRLALRAYRGSYGVRRLGIALTHSRPFRLAIKPYLHLMALARRCTVLTVAARPVAGHAGVSSLNQTQRMP